MPPTCKQTPAGAAVAALQQHVACLMAQITALTQRDEQLAGEFTGIDSQIELVQADVAAAEALISTLQTDVNVIGGSITQINVILGQYANGVVVLVTENFGNEYFMPAANTGAGRMNALRLALLEATSHPSAKSTVQLLAGDFIIPDGFPLTTYATAGNVKITTSEKAPLLYQNPDDAKSDWSLFEGPRDITHFGAFRQIQLMTNAAALPFDSSMALMAALNSLPPFTPGALDADGNTVRRGSVYAPGGPGTWYYFSDPIVLQQSHEFSSEQRGITLCALTGMAPVLATDVYFIRMALNEDGANATHDVKLSGGFILTSYAGNPGLCGVYWAGAQVNEIDISVSSLKRGVIVPSGSCFLKVKNLDCFGLTHGPALDLQGDAVINHIEIGTCSAVFCNTAFHEEEGHPIPAYRLKNVVHFSGASMLAEQCADGVKFDNCRNIVFGGIQHQKMPSPPMGAVSTAVRLVNSFFMGPFSINGIDVDNLVIDNLGEGIAGGAGLTFSRYETDTYARKATFEMAKIRTGLLNGFRVYRDDSAQPIKSIEFGARVGNSSNPTWTFRGLDVDDAFIKDFILIANHAGGADTGYEIFLRPTKVNGILASTGAIFPAGGIAARVGTADPTTSDFAAGIGGQWHNITSGEVRDWINRGGVMYKSAAYTT